MSKKAKIAAKVNEAPLPAAIKESAQQIWSVGVGAITRAHQQSNRVFDAIVREGESLRENLHKKTKGAAGAGVTEVASRATDTWDKLEQVFEKRVERALSSLGVPTRSEIAELNARIDALSKALASKSANSPSSNGRAGKAVIAGHELASAKKSTARRISKSSS